MHRVSVEKIRATSRGPGKETREGVCLMPFVSPNYLYIAFFGFSLVIALVLKLKKKFLEMIILLRFI